MRERLKQLTDEVRSSEFGNKTHLIDKGEFSVINRGRNTSVIQQQMTHNQQLKPIIESGRKILADMLLS